MSDQGAGGAFNPIAEALRLLDLFASVGADAFDITHTNLHQEKRGFRPAQTLAQARASIPYLVPSAARRQNNLIVRPRSKTVALIQLDDLPPDNLARIAPAAFLVLQTSPQGLQAWVAVTAAPKGFAARLKEGTGANKEASGATRVAGTANFKPAYAPDFPTVRIVAAQPGRIVAPATLEALGVVAPEKAHPIPPPWLLEPPPRRAPANGQVTPAASKTRRSARAATPSAPAPILCGARLPSHGDTASKTPPRGSCWKARRRRKTAKPMPARPPNMPSSPHGSATPPEGSQDRWQGRGEATGGFRFRPPRELAKFARWRALAAWVMGRVVRTAETRLAGRWRGQGIGSYERMSRVVRFPAFLWTSRCTTPCVTRRTRLTATDRTPCPFLRQGAVFAFG